MENPPLSRFDSENVPDPDEGSGGGAVETMEDFEKLTIHIGIGEEEINVQRARVHYVRLSREKLSPFEQFEADQEIDFLETFIRIAACHIRRMRRRHRAFLFGICQKSAA